MSLSYREANLADEDLYLIWANDDEVRSNAFNTQKIKSEDHHRWFGKKLQDGDALMLVFSDQNNIPVGQVRIDKGDYWQVDVSIDKNHRGKGFGVQMLKLSLIEFSKKIGKNIAVYSLIKKQNIASVRIFEKAGFVLDASEESKDFYKYIFVS